jgi:hypothetical protein
MFRLDKKGIFVALGYGVIRASKPKRIARGSIWGVLLSFSRN